MGLLDEVTSKPPATPPLIVIHGPSGSRKTQMAIDAGALILQTEQGLGNREANALPIKDVDHLLAVIKELATTEHDYKIVALDSLDHLVPLVVAHVCAANNKPTLEAFGFGKGQMAEVDQWRIVMDYLIRLKNRKGVPVLLLAHQVTRSVSDPTQMEPYDRIEPKLPKQVNALIKELCDVMGAVSPRMAIKENEKGQNRAVGNGEFDLHLGQIPSIDAKNRYRLPTKCDMSWAALSALLPKAASNG